MKMITSTKEPAITFFSNGESKMKKITYEKIVTTLLSICTAAILAGFGFMWNANSTLAEIREHQKDKDKAIDDMQIKINNMQLDIRDSRERTIRIEAILKPH